MTNLPASAKQWRLSDFDFDLPADLIAQSPAMLRTGSRLLLPGVPVKDAQFADLPSLLNPGDLLVFNNSKVIKARLHGQKASGGQVEALIERVLCTYEALSQLRVSKKPAPGSFLHFANEKVAVLGREGEFFKLRFQRPVLDVLEAIGELPLPPYIEHSSNNDDAARYQTVYAKHLGSVAAPTAGLHFDDSMLEMLRAKGVQSAFVTLHVGAGTFAPVRTDIIAEHKMHSERYRIDETCAQAIADTRARGGRVIAVGTTSLRTLEGAALKQNASTGQNTSALKQTGATLTADEDETALFITPGFEFRIVDALVTNFHLPKSTLLMLVSAFAGYETIRAAYRHAIEKRYRFFSYGDAMFLQRSAVQDN